MTITILYDNYIHQAGTRSAWGFSCLVEVDDTTIMFDTGGEAAVLLGNCEALKVDLTSIDMIVISHNHWDHSGGLQAVLEKTDKKVNVFLPPSFKSNIIHTLEQSGAHITVVTEPQLIADQIWVIGPLGSKIVEQSLVLDRGTTSLVITGCCHPGLHKTITAAQNFLKKPVSTILGGFHLKDHSAEDVISIIQWLKENGVISCGPSHCSGDQAIDLFRKAFGKGFIKLGTGSVLETTQ